MNLTNTDQKTGADLTMQEMLTNHAKKRMCARNLGLRAIQAALDFGRVVYTRGAVIHAIGKKEVRRHRTERTDLCRFEGVHVVCAPDGRVITTYRNRDFRKLRPGLGFPRFAQSYNNQH